jgi:hypothetical protein
MRSGDITVLRNFSAGFRPDPKRGFEPKRGMLKAIPGALGAPGPVALRRPGAMPILGA